ncbi:nitrate- and nitrite sensing domain-containing protein [Kitasatospora sp. NPDC091207]|uniref:sensor histidine kinase n=1 Tax=Kitasatospora sp. NPDC091207 TaxID=3364083 RepID=UPI00381AAF85
MTSIASSKARAPGRFDPTRPAASPKESALRARANRRPPTPKSPRRRPRLSLRTALLVLAVVPSLALAALWAVTSGQTFLDFQRQAAQGLLAQKAGQPSNHVYYNLQEERRLSAEALARPGSVTDALRRQRQLTDDAVRQFQVLSGETADSAPAEVRDAVTEARQAMGKLTEQRAAIDRAAVDQQTAFAYYTDLIAVDLRLFTALSHVDNGEVTWISKTLVDAFWAKEMLAREDAVLARGWPSGKLTAADYQLVQQSIGAQEHLFEVQVVPYIPAGEAGAWQDLMAGPAWQAKAAVEQSLLRATPADPSGAVKLPASQDQWRQALDQLNPQLVKAIETRTDGIVEVGKGSFLSLLTAFVLTTVIGLIAVVAVILTSWRLTRSLRRRIKVLHTQAQELERTLPEVVERLSRGEQVDVEAESRAITADPHGNGTDELSRLGQALNLARTSALETSVRQADQHRGFERLLQRIARRTQLLIGQQLRKLDELERKHEDPEVLEGLFDLDHLTARLRRYEENLVILAGGHPQRRWRKPVPLLDVLRAAQSEVQDYRRIMLDVEGHPWLNERAVGPVAHVIAELMENAASFSKPPTPVEVRAAMVGRGLAVEIEDRGLGMDPEQYDAANELMSRPPRMDVLARADDIRLGFYVVSRLAANSNLKIEFRPSAFGGTRVVVLVPDELVIDGDAGLPDATPVEPIPLARRTRKTGLTALTAGQDHGAPTDPEATLATAVAPAPPAIEPPETVLVPSAAAPNPAEAFAHVEYIQPPTPEQPVEHSSPVDGTAGYGSEGYGTGGYGTGGHVADGHGGVEYGTTGYRTDGYPTAGYPTTGYAPDALGADGYGTTGYGTEGYGADAHGGSYDPSAAGTTGYDAPAGPAHDAYDALGTPDAPGTPAAQGSPAQEAPTPAYPDIAYATVSPAEAPYADEQYRPADHYRLAERREYASTVPLSEPAGGQAPLPQRVRQASLAAELRVPPPPPEAAAERVTGAPGMPGSFGTPIGSAGAFQRPPRRSGAAIGAFQRQSRVARGQDSGEVHLPQQSAFTDRGPHPAPPTGPTGSPTPAPGPSPWALPAADPRTTRTDDQS